MAEGLWAFSLGFYAPPDVQAACLRLQDDHGGDVNLALCLLWHGRAGREIGAEGVAGLEAAVAPWRGAVVAPIRTLRRSLKTERLLDPEPQEGFRTKLKKLELDAEKLEQLALEAVPVTPLRHLPPEQAAQANLLAYGALLGGLPADLIEILAARAVTLD